jgi:putative oxidoreductase
MSLLAVIRSLVVSPLPVPAAWYAIPLRLIVVGALVPLATIPMAVVLLVAILTVHLPNGFSSIKLQSFDAAGAHFGQPGYETDLLYLGGLVAHCLGGAGPFSVDGYLSGAIREAAKPTTW